MNNNLLIVGAGTYAVLASEIAEEMGCFEKIDFIDDVRKTTANGRVVVGTSKDLCKLSEIYGYIVVAIGNPDVRLSLIHKIKSEMSYRVISLISPRAYVSPSAKIMEGCIIEPMAVVHTLSVISTGCIISAGAVVNHESTCLDGVHVDCNATVEGYCTVPENLKIHSGEVYKKQ